MKKIIYLYTILFCTTFYAQNKIFSESLAISKPDLTTNIYEKDSTANALVLYEYGNTFIDKNTFKINFEFKQKLKIFNKNAFDHATIKVYLYKSNGKEVKIKNIKATTHNLSGDEISKTKLNKSDIYVKTINENFDEVTFTFPAVKAGSVITYSYELVDPFSYKFIPWEFQTDIPKLYSEYNTSIPGNYVYHIKLVGGRGLSVNTSDIKKNCLQLGYGTKADCVVSKYVMKDIPSIIEEDYMTDIDNYRARIEYELNTFKGFDGTVNYYTKSWEDVDKELKSDLDIGKQLKKLNLSKDILPDSIFTISSKLNKAKAIFNFVKSNYIWNGRHDLYKDSSVKDLIKEKTGSAAEINILLHNLLKENEINASPLLISTRNNGFATRVYPVISDFNYILTQVKIDDKPFFLDATNKYHFFGEIPYKCFNQYGRLLDFKNGSSWVEIKPINNSSVTYFSELKLGNNAITGSLKSRYINYKALRKKENYFANPKNYINPAKSGSKNYKEEEITVVKPNKDTNLFQDSKTIVIDELEKIDTKIYFNPFLEIFFNQNPFKLHNRTYPIDFGYKDSYNYFMTLTIDDGYKFIDFPENEVIKFSDNSAGISFSISQMNNKISVNFKIYFKNSIYSAENYQALKNLFNKIIDIQNNSLLVIEKTR